MVSQLDIAQLSGEIGNYDGCAKWRNRNVQIAKHVREKMDFLRGKHSDWRLTHDYGKSSQMSSAKRRKR